MYTAVIEGRERKLKATAGSVMRLSKKYKEQIGSLIAVVDSDEEINEELREDEFLEFIFEMVWEFLVPNIFGLKVFFTYERFKDKVDNLELNEASKAAFFLLRGVPPEEYERIKQSAGEGREQKKVTSSPPGSGSSP